MPLGSVYIYIERERYGSVRHDKSKISAMRGGGDLSRFIVQGFIISLVL